MKLLKLADLVSHGRHIFEGLISGGHIGGGLSFKKPGQRTHEKGCRCASCDGKGRHVHDDCEAFVFLEGKAVVEVNGEEHRVTAGDVVIIEPGEEHHVCADREFPCVNLWLHGRDMPVYLENK